MSVVSFFRSRSTTFNPKWGCRHTSKIHGLAFIFSFSQHTIQDPLCWFTCHSHSTLLHLWTRYFKILHLGQQLVPTPKCFFHPFPPRGSSRKYFNWEFFILLPFSVAPKDRVHPWHGNRPERATNNNSQSVNTCFVTVKCFLCSPAVLLKSYKNIYPVTFPYNSVLFLFTHNITLKSSVFF